MEPNNEEDMTWETEPQGIYMPAKLDMPQSDLAHIVNYFGEHIHGTRYAFHLTLFEEERERETETDADIETVFILRLYFRRTFIHSMERPTTEGMRIAAKNCDDLNADFLRPPHYADDDKYVLITKQIPFLDVVADYIALSEKFGRTIFDLMRRYKAATVIPIMRDYDDGVAMFKTVLEETRKVVSEEPEWTHNE
jgi:hypothetical protein